MKKRILIYFGFIIFSLLLGFIITVIPVLYSFRYLRIASDGYPFVFITFMDWGLYPSSCIGFILDIVFWGLISFIILQLRFALFKLFKKVKNKIGFNNLIRAIYVTIIIILIIYILHMHNLVPSSRFLPGPFSWRLSLIRGQYCQALDLYFYINHLIN